MPLFKLLGSFTFLKRTTAKFNRVFCHVTVNFHNQHKHRPLYFKVCKNVNNAFNVHRYVIAY
jgi:hypothetical protein